MSKYLSLIAVGTVFLGGCTLAPDYERPASPVGENWPQGLRSEEGSGMLAADLDWQNFYEDARLRQLIGIALENNRDLRIAALNVELLRAQYQIQRSNLLPTLGGSAGMTRQHTPASLSQTGAGVTGNSFNVGVGVTSYEIDLFGRIRSLNRQALENFLATEEARKSVQIALIAEVANQYLSERASADQLGISRSMLKVVSDSLELIQSRYDLGAATLLDLRTAEAQVENARASVALYEQRWGLFRNGLELLLGTALPDDLAPALPLEQTQFAEDVDAGLPSDLLVRRPDIRAAEHRLIGANANIGAARAAFFPSIFLTASGGTASAQLSDLFKPGSGAWQFAPTISVPIFTGGRNRAGLDAAKTGKSIEIAQYEKTIQTAFREVSDALTTRKWIGDRLDAMQKQVDALQERFDLANARYELGVDNYLTVLTAQQDLFRSQQELIDVRRERLDNFVELYKVLGGGWNGVPAEATEATKTAEAAHSGDSRDNGKGGQLSNSAITAKAEANAPQVDNWGVFGTGN